MDHDRLAQLLHDVRRCGVYQLPNCGRSTLEGAAGAAGIGFTECNFEESDDFPYALGLLAEALALPDWFGGNLDALHDCLTDLSWREAPATVLLLTGCDGLRAGDPDRFDTFLEVFTAASEYWRDAAVPFWVFVDLRADGLAALPMLG